MDHEYLMLYIVLGEIDKVGMVNNMYTVEPLLKGSPNNGHHRNYLPTKDTL